MHELGVVFALIKQVKEVAMENKVTKVTKISVDLGEVSTVIPYLLTDCFNWAITKEENELLKDCALEINQIKAVTICNHCGHEYSTVEFAKICPKCKSDDTYLKEGNEFIIKTIEAI